MPSKKKILEYWHKKSVHYYPDNEELTRLEEFGKCQPQKTLFALYGERADINRLKEIEKRDFCFACGLMKVTQRAHILAVFEGGTDEVENLHLLCKNCHDESEFVSGEEYWLWFKEKDENIALQYWLKSKESQFNRFKEKILSIKPENEWTNDELTNFAKDYLRNGK